MVKKSTLFARNFSGKISMGKNFFLSNFLKLRQVCKIARLFSLNFLIKSPWFSPVPLKFKSCNLQRCKKNSLKLVFWVFTEQLLHQIIFWRLHCYEVTLVKSVINHYFKLVEQNFGRKKIYKKLLQSQRD